MDPTSDKSSPESIRIACPGCAAINRVPARRLSGGPACGKCHSPLFAARPTDLDASAFERHLTRSGIPLLVDFWAPWCGPCQSMAPAYAQVAAELEPRVRVAKVNTELEQALGARFAIRSIPTLVMFAGGKEIARQSGVLGTAEILRWAGAHL